MGLGTGEGGTADGLGAAGNAGKSGVDSADCTVKRGPRKTGNVRTQEGDCCRAGLQGLQGQ